MKKLLKSNGKPTISGSDKMLYADENISAKGGHDSYVTDKITYEYEVTDIIPSSSSITAFPSSGSVTFNSVIRKKVNDNIINEVNGETTFNLNFYNKFDLQGKYNWYSNDVNYSFAQTKGIAQVLYYKIVNMPETAQYEDYQTGYINDAKNKFMIEKGYIPIGILVSTAEECGEDENGDDRYFALTNVESTKYLTYGNNDYFGTELYNGCRNNSNKTANGMGISNNTTRTLGVPSEMKEDASNPFYGQSRFYLKREGDSIYNDDMETTYIIIHKTGTTYTKEYKKDNNCTILEDFNGKEHTEYLIKTTAKVFDNENNVILNLYKSSFPEEYNELLTDVKYNDGKCYATASTEDTYCPAALQCSKYSTFGAEKGWYLPSVGELYNALIKNNYHLNTALEILQNCTIKLYHYNDGIARSIDDFTGYTEDGTEIGHYYNFEYLTDMNTDRENWLKHRYCHGDYIKSKLSIASFNGKEYYYCEMNDPSIKLRIDTLPMDSYNSSTFNSLARSNVWSGSTKTYTTDNQSAWCVRLGDGIGKKNCGAMLDYRHSPNYTRPMYKGNFRDEKYHQML